jgi:hypothetical protein
LHSFKFGENRGLNLANIFAGKCGFGGKTRKIYPKRRGKFNINLYGQARNRRLLPKTCKLGDKLRANRSQKADLAQNPLAERALTKIYLADFLAPPFFGLPLLRYTV